MVVWPPGAPVKFVVSAAFNDPDHLLELAVCGALAMALTRTGPVLGRFGVEAPDYVVLLTSFPVATGALAAMVWEACTRPRAAR